MATQDFHFLMQNGCLYKNVKVLTEHGYAKTCAEVYWNLKGKGYVYILKDKNAKSKKILLEDIYHFCISSKYNLPLTEETDNHKFHK